LDIEFMICCLHGCVLFENTHNPNDNMQNLHNNGQTQEMSIRAFWRQYNCMWWVDINL